MILDLIFFPTASRQPPNAMGTRFQGRGRRRYRYATGEVHPALVWGAPLPRRSVDHKARGPEAGRDVARSALRVLEAQRLHAELARLRVGAALGTPSARAGPVAYTAVASGDRRPRGTVLLADIVPVDHSAMVLIAEAISVGISSDVSPSTFTRSV